MKFTGAGFLILEHYKDIKTKTIKPAIVLFGMLLRKEGFVFTIPGGGIEEGESRSKAASRELYEETAKMIKIIPKKMQQYKHVDIPFRNKTEAFRTYYGFIDGLSRNKFLKYRDKLLQDPKTSKVYLETRDMVHVYMDDLYNYMKKKTRKVKTVDGKIIRLRSIFEYSLRKGLMKIIMKYK